MDRGRRYALLLAGALVLPAAVGLAGCQAADVVGEAAETPAAEAPVEETTAPVDTGMPEDDASEGDGAEAAEPEEAEPGPEDVNGRWCPTPESVETACLEIELPRYRFVGGHDGEVLDTAELEEGGLSLAMEGAPLGVFYRADEPAPYSDSYPTAGVAGQEHIWNSQVGTVYLRD